MLHRAYKRLLIWQLPPALGSRWVPWPRVLLADLYKDNRFSLITTLIALAPFNGEMVSPSVGERARIRESVGN